MEIKKEFLKIEKERFVTFMDGLMAIIMTIMVLEIKIPAVETLTDETLRPFGIRPVDDRTLLPRR